MFFVGSSESVIVMDSKSFQEEVKQLRSKKLGLPDEENNTELGQLRSGKSGLLDEENNKIELHV